MDLPAFRYHPDPIRSGSIVASDETCLCCGEARGYVYTGPSYCEEEIEDALCPWCIADGSAHRKFAAEFFDAAGIDEDVPESAVKEITERTPGFSTWQEGHWPACCGDAAAFLMPSGIKEIREQCYELEGGIMSHIVHEMQISGGAATRLLDSLKKDAGPTVYVFRCLKCLRHHFHIDQP